MAQHNITGQKGEKEAVKYLRSKGYEIKACNWRYLKAELDIIAHHSNTLVVIEVKTRKDNEFGDPELFVTKQKQRNIIKAANAYVLEKKLDVNVRFDIITILGNGETLSIHHIEDAFYATMH